MSLRTIDYSKIEQRVLAHAENPFPVFKPAPTTGRLHRLGPEPQTFTIKVNAEDIDFINMTKERYLALLSLAPDTVTRSKLKLWAYTAMYGGDPQGTVTIPLHLYKEVIDVETDRKEEA